jgi:hypothetical protein
VCSGAAHHLNLRGKLGVDVVPLPLCLADVGELGFRPGAKVEQEQERSWIRRGWSKGDGRLCWRASHLCLDGVSGCVPRYQVLLCFCPRDGVRERVRVRECVNEGQRKKRRGGRGGEGGETKEGGREGGRER